MMTNGRGGSTSSPLPTPMPDDPALVEAKRALRRRLRDRRAELHRRLAATAGTALRRHFLDAVPVPAESVVAGYVPVADELDDLPLLHHLHQHGRVCTLPVVTARARPLIFRGWRPGCVLLPGPFAIPAPGPEAPEHQPTVVIVPLLAFDRAGHRMGYGAGFYDRTLAALRAVRPVIAVGVGYAGQEVDAVPAGPHDQPLDWIVTEASVIRIAAASRVEGCAPIEACAKENRVP